MALLHIELEGERSEESKAFHLPTTFSSPVQTAGQHSATGATTPTATSNSTASTGRQAPPKDKNANISTRTRTRMAADPPVQESSFNVESLRAALPEIETRFERVEHRVSANEDTLGHVQFQVDNIEEKISIMKGNFSELEGLIFGFYQDIDWIQEDLDNTSERAKKIENRMNILNITNSNLVDLYDSLSKSMKDIKAKVDTHNATNEALFKHATSVKNHLSNRIDALDQNLQTHVKEDSETYRQFEVTLAEIKESMKSFSQPAENIDIPVLQFKTNEGAQFMLVFSSVHIVTHTLHM